MIRDIQTKRLSNLWPCWWCGWRRRRVFSRGARGSWAPLERRAPRRSSCSWTESAGERCRALLSVATHTHRVHSQAKGDATGQAHLWLPEVDAFRGHLHFPPENDGKDLKQEQKTQKQSRSQDSGGRGVMSLRLAIYNYRLFRWCLFYGGNVSVSILRLPASLQNKMREENLARAWFQGSKY